MSLPEFKIGGEWKLPDQGYTSSTTVGALTSDSVNGYLPAIRSNYQSQARLVSPTYSFMNGWDIQAFHAFWYVYTKCGTKKWVARLNLDGVFKEYICIAASAPSPSGYDGTKGSFSVSMYVIPKEG